MLQVMKRVVVPEILDDLPMDDPAAQASRKDLRRINFLMGNERWIIRQLSTRPDIHDAKIVEWGAGDGGLTAKLAKLGNVTALDLVGKPQSISDDVEWIQGDIFKTELTGDILVTNLFLHHFEGDALLKLGEKAKGFDYLIGVEPWRSSLALMQGRMLLPFVSRVTRHDMIVSIKAGFESGELAQGLDLSEDDWDIKEAVCLRGGLRWMAKRRK